MNKTDHHKSQKISTLLSSHLTEIVQMQHKNYSVKFPKAIQPAMEKLFSGQWKTGAIPELWDGKTAERIVEILMRM